MRIPLQAPEAKTAAVASERGSGGSPALTAPIWNELRVALNHVMDAPDRHRALQVFVAEAIAMSAAATGFLLPNLAAAVAERREFKSAGGVPQAVALALPVAREIAPAIAERLADATDAMLWLFPVGRWAQAGWLCLSFGPEPAPQVVDGLGVFCSLAGCALHRPDSGEGAALGALTSLDEDAGVDAVLDAILSQACTSTGACLAAVFVLDAAASTLAARRACGQDGGVDLLGDARFAGLAQAIDAAVSPTWARLQHEAGFAVECSGHPVSDAPVCGAWHVRRGHRAVVLHALEVGARRLGCLALWFDTPGPNAWSGWPGLATGRALALQAALTIHVSSVVERAREVERLGDQKELMRNRAEELVAANASLTAVIRQITDAGDFKLAPEVIFREIALAAGADVCHWWELDEAKGTIRPRFSVRDGTLMGPCVQGDPRAFGEPIPVEESFTFKQDRGDDSFISHYPFELDPALPEARATIEWNRAQGIQESAGYIVKIGELPVGIIRLRFRKRGSLTAGRADLVRAMAKQLALAVQLTRLAETARQAAIMAEQEHASRERAAELAKANRALRASLDHLRTGTDLDSFLVSAMREMRGATGAWCAYLFRYDPVKNQLALRIADRGDGTFFGTAPGDPVLFHAPFDADITPAWSWAKVRGHTHLSSDVRPIPEAWPGTVDWHLREGHVLRMSRALRTGDIPVGFIGLAFRTHVTLSDADWEVLSALENQLALALRLLAFGEDARERAVLAERTRIAGEIHDSLAQALAGVVIQLDAAREAAARGRIDIDTFISQARDLASFGLAEARLSVLNLRPEAFEQDELTGALRKLVARMRVAGSIECAFNVIGEPRDISPALRHELFRVAQEASGNALKHARARLIELQLEYGVEDLKLSVRDDGRGFDVSDPTLGAPRGAVGEGLLSMQRRCARIGASLQVHSAPGVGTTVAVSVALT